jgi:hypothetical protein
MAAILTGIMTGMRVVGGQMTEGKRRGEQWVMLSMEISDGRNVWSCQLGEEDKQFVDFVELKGFVENDDGKMVPEAELKIDLTDHKVKATIKSQTAGEREIGQNGNKRKIMQIRTRVTNVRDLGIPEDEDE